jgi:hypothetical protein
MIWPFCLSGPSQSQNDHGRVAGRLPIVCSARIETLIVRPQPQLEKDRMDVHKAEVVTWGQSLPISLLSLQTYLNNWSLGSRYVRSDIMLSVARAKA